MAMTNDHDTNVEKKILVQANGPYRVQGDIPLVRKTQSFPNMASH